MTLKRLLLLLLLTLTAWPVMAQTTTTGTITDPQGNPYANGTASAQKSVATGQVQPPPVNVTTNGSGTFSMSLPSPASYIFTICAAPTQIGPTGNPTPSLVCFSNVNPIAISGGSQDVSGSLNPVAKNLGPNITGVSGVVSAGTAGQLAQYAANGNVVSGTTSVPFSYLTSFPVACPANQVAVQVGLTLGCASLTTAYLPLTGTWAFTGTMSGNYFNSGTVTNNGPVVNNAGVTSNTETVTGAASLNGGGALVGTFTGNRTETGTVTNSNTINPCRLGNVRYVDTANTCTWSGTDFTGWFAAAYADLPSTGGKIHIVLGQYSTGCITGPCVQFAINNKGIQIECDNAGANISAPDAGATRLSFPSLSSGFGIQFVNGAAMGQGITGCDLVGPGTGTTTGGVQVGGAGGSGLTFGVWLVNTNITNFGTSGGLAFGNGAGFFRADGGQVHDNGKNLFFPSGITSATEGFRFNNVLFQNKNAALYLNSVDIESPVNDLSFYAPHFDQAQVVLNGGSSFNVGTYITDAHVENPNGAIGTGDANALIRNINNNTTITNIACIIDNAVGGNECISHAAGNMTVIGFGAQANAGTATNAISANCTGCGLNIYSTHYLNSVTNLLTTNSSAPVLFNGGFSITDQQLSNAGCTTPAVAGNSCVTPITFTLVPAMPDVNYRVLCTPAGVPTNLPGAPYLQGVPTATTFTVNYIALSAAAASYPNVTCRATHN